MAGQAAGVVQEAPRASGYTTLTLCVAIGLHESNAARARCGHRPGRSGVGRARIGRVRTAWGGRWKRRAGWLETVSRRSSSRPSTTARARPPPHGPPNPATNTRENLDGAAVGYRRCARRARCRRRDHGASGVRRTGSAKAKAARAFDERDRARPRRPKLTKPSLAACCLCLPGSSITQVRSSRCRRVHRSSKGPSASSSPAPSTLRTTRGSWWTGEARSRVTPTASKAATVTATRRSRAETEWVRWRPPHPALTVISASSPVP